MTDLDDDIARIAALRGRKPDAYIEAARHSPAITRPAVERILAPNPNPRTDQEFFDHLPAKTRAFIRSQERPLNAMWWYHLLHEAKDEDEIIKAVLYCLGAT